MGTDTTTTGTGPTDTGTADTEGPRARVTLITTVRDGERFLAEALHSIAAQSFEAWRLVLVDDGSTDRTPDIARAFCEVEPRCQLFVRPPRGRLEALRFAHAQVETEYVAWVDADDRLRPHALEACVEALDGAPWSVMVFSLREVISAGGERRSTRPRGRPTGTNLLRSFSTFHFRLIRSMAFEAAGGIGRYPIAIDYDLCLRLWELGPVLGLEEVLYEYRRHPAQMSSANRHAQVEASSSAIRDAIARQGFESRLCLRLEGERPRFELARPEFEGSLDRRHRIRQAIRRRLPGTRIRTAAVWSPCPSHLETLVVEGLHRRGVVVVPTRPTLEGLEAIVQARSVPDLLVLRGLRSAIASMGTESVGRLLGVLARLRIEGCRVVWWDWEAGFETHRSPRVLRNPWLRRVELLPPSAAGLVVFGDRRQARSRLGLAAEDVVVVVFAHCDAAARGALAELAERPGQVRVLMFGSQMGETQRRVTHVDPRPRARRDAIAAADLVMFTDDWGVPADPWCEAVAAGRAVHVRGRLRNGLLQRLGDAVPILQGPMQLRIANPDRASWRACGLQLRDALAQAHDPKSFVAALIEDLPTGPARSGARRQPT